MAFHLFRSIWVRLVSILLAIIIVVGIISLQMSNIFQVECWNFVYLTLFNSNSCVRECIISTLLWRWLVYSKQLVGQFETFILFILPYTSTFIQQVLIEVISYARHCSWLRGLTRQQQSLVPDLKAGVIIVFKLGNHDNGYDY